jgi:uncharacterized damage-inducible protein DinB
MCPVQNVYYAPVLTHTRVNAWFFILHSVRMSACATRVPLPISKYSGTRLPKSAAAEFDIRQSLISAFATNNRIDCYLIENLAAEARAAKPPEGKGRTIAAIAIHIHNVRLMWLKAGGVAKLPVKLEENASAKDTLQALDESHQAMAKVLEGALDSGQVKRFKPDAPSFFAYLIAHDAHHRGQIASLARRLGHPIPQSVGFGMWEWGSRAKEV